MSPSPPNLQNATAELKAREPIFHRPEFGTTRRDFESMLTGDFSEVGASGHRYVRAYVLDALAARHRQGIVENLVVSEFECVQLSPTLFLVTYLLDNSGRVSRRSTIWQWEHTRWLAKYHQGTPVAGW